MMDQVRSNDMGTALKSILLLAGAFTFAFLLAEMVHEFGHYLAHQIYHTPGVAVHLDPFGGSRITGVTTLSRTALLVTTVAGPLFNLLLGLSTASLLWRFRRPVLLPLLLWGPVALVQEGVNLSLGLLSPGSDAAWIATLLPQIGVLLLGLLLLVGGTMAIPLLLPLAAIQSDQSPRRVFMVLLVGMGTLMLIRFGYSLVASPDSIQEDLYPLVFAIFLSVIIVTIHRSISRKVRVDDILAPVQVPDSTVVFAWVFAGGMFLFQLLALN